MGSYSDSSDLEHLLAGCDAEQRVAITTEAAPVLLIAGAGSGKTRVLTRRIAWRIFKGDAEAVHVLALTFTRKAAAEMRSRLACFDLPGKVTAGTFHAVALTELRRYELESGRRAPVLVDHKATLLGQILGEGRPHDRYRSRSAGTGPRMRRDQIATIAAEIEWAASRLVSPEDYPTCATSAKRQISMPFEQVAEAYSSYRTAKRRKGLVDFDDLLTGLTNALRRDRDFAAAQSWRFRHFFVDELQDATPAQLALLQAWLARRNDLFAVGDPRQAIYGWNGAETDVVGEFTRRFPFGQVLSLAANHRSSPQVVAVATSVLTGQTAPLTTRPDGNTPTVRRYDDDKSEAAGVAKLLRLAHRPGRQWSDLAVLARTNAQLHVIEQELQAARIPSRSTSGAAFLSLPGVRASLGDLVSLGDTTRAWRAWLTDLELELETSDQTFSETTPTGGTSTDGHAIDSPSGLRPNHNELNVLIRLGREYMAVEAVPNGDAFIAWARSALRADSSPFAHDAVDLATFHRAKGLEWTVVCVTGLEDGLVPIVKAKGNEALEEERRLLYVALTRATEELHCSWAGRRSFGETISTRNPSAWLALVAAAVSELEQKSALPDSDVRSYLAASRAALGERHSPSDNKVS